MFFANNNKFSLQSFLAKTLFIRILFLAESYFIREVDSDLHHDGGLIFGFWWHRCGCDVLFALLSSSSFWATPSASPSPSPGSSFITLTWETQKDFFHPRALMFSLLESRCAVLFTRYFVAAILSPPFFFFLSPFSSTVCSPFHADDISRCSCTFYSFFVVFFYRVISFSCNHQNNNNKSYHAIFS